MKYSASAVPEYGAIYCNGAGSDAVEDTTTVYSMAPASRSVVTIFAMVEAF